MIVGIGYFVLGLLLLLLGGDSVVKGASGLAQRLGWSPFKAGLLLVAFATSIPELAVNAYAFHAGNIDLALGNAVGSNVVNIGLTLAVAAIATPLLLQMRLLAGQIVFLLIATGLLLVFALDGVLARWEGAVLLAGFVGLLAYMLGRGKNEPVVVQEELAAFAQTRLGLVQNLLRLVIASVVLFFGGKLVVENASLIGTALGLGPLLTGLLLVAVATALPEVVTAVMAARQGQPNVVAGHVLGASLFNLLFIVGGLSTAVLKPLAIPASFVWLELPAAMAFVLALYPIFAGDLRISRREGGLLLALFLAFMAFELAIAWR
jgi:cation:H+ antiporter